MINLLSKILCSKNSKNYFIALNKKRSYKYIYILPCSNLIFMFIFTRVKVDRRNRSNMSIVKPISIVKNKILYTTRAKICLIIAFISINNIWYSLYGLVHRHINLEECNKEAYFALIV